MFDTADLNSAFGSHLSSDNGMEKMGAVLGTYIQEKFRENAFTNKVLPPQTVTEAELTRNVNDEGLVFIDDLEPDSLAMHVNWRAEPTKVWLQAPRYEIHFHNLATPVFNKTENELRSYRMPITKVLEQNLVKDLEEQVDVQFMEEIRAAVMFGTQDRINTLAGRGQFTNAYAAGGEHWLQNEAQLASYLLTGAVATIGTTGALTNATTFDAGFSAAHANYDPATALQSNILLLEEPEFSRVALAELVRIPSARAQEAKVFLMHDYDYKAIIKWSDTEAGLQLTSEIVTGGYKYTTIAGYTFVTTVRDNPDIIQPGQIFVFPAPNFMGRNLTLGKLQFQMKRGLGPQIQMMAWMDIGIGIGNMKGIGLALLRGGRITLPRIFFTNARAAVGGAREFTLVNDPAAPLG